jgi:hypothetical protein
VNDVIVKVGNWSRHPLANRLCEALLKLPGASKKSTPQRCVIRVDNTTVATVGVDKNDAVVEFLPCEECYAAAHGSGFVKPHPLQSMAREGWLQARPANEQECDQLADWLFTSVRTRHSS